MNRRKVTFKLYPNPRAAERLTKWVRLHCELYNAALQERIEACSKAAKSVSLYHQHNALPQIKLARPEFVERSHALQQTLRRLDLAFQGFFRRVRAGKTPGFPRFNEAMSIRVRGQHRFGLEAKANDLTMTRKHGEWFASVTLRVPESACARMRTEHQHRGVDFGIPNWATLDNGETISNPRWMRNELPRLAELQRQRAKKKDGSARCRRLSRQAARLHERIGMAHRMPLYKAEEAGSRLHLSNTRQLKPSQRCARCREIAPKPLAQRVHQCPYCGHTMPRDQNSALVVLTDAHTPGTGVAARQTPLAAKAGKPRSKTRETLASARQV